MPFVVVGAVVVSNSFGWICVLFWKQRISLVRQTLKLQCSENGNLTKFGTGKTKFSSYKSNYLYNAVQLPHRGNKKRHIFIRLSKGLRFKRVVLKCHLGRINKRATKFSISFFFLQVWVDSPVWRVIHIQRKCDLPHHTLLDFPESTCCLNLVIPVH